ncbi:unnamed protein product [Ceutorhynchus assimilis]|uniref:Uncharacterized protein n=1 Tax=Ceutorhynchus assimilis TaxID=467358 RepID=A0A9N9MFB3_9CUCU|nr:unnamed protein product [Ceutorhynchus assimilis]
MSKILIIAVILVSTYAIHIVDHHAYPKYEFKYGVEDPHTGDRKERIEVRDGDVVKQEYAWGEKDREVRVSKIDAHDVPVHIAIKGHHY